MDNQNLNPVSNQNPLPNSVLSSAATTPSPNQQNSINSSPPSTNSDLDSLIAQSLLDQPYSPSPQPLIGSSNKEVLPTKTNLEAAPIQEIVENEPLPVEVEGWLQKLENVGDIKLPEPITHDGQVLLSEPENQVIKEKLVLPISQNSLNQGLVLKVTDSARWLAEWCLRLVKKVNGAVIFVSD